MAIPRITAVVTGTMQLGTPIDGLNHLQIVTRGWLVDVTAVRGVDQLRGGDVITTEDVHQALGAGEPGTGTLCFFIRAGVACGQIRTATWPASQDRGYGPVPAEDQARPFEVPQTLNVRHGVFVVENLDTSELAANGVTEFAFILTHPKLRGATGSWTSPIAMV